MAWNFCREPGLGTPVVGLGSKHCCLAQTNSKSSEFRLKTSLPSILLLAWAQQQCFRPRQEFWAVASYSMVSAVLWQYENRKKHLVKTQLNKKIKIAPSNKKLTSLCWELRRACWRHLVAPVPLPRFEFPCCIPLIINITCMSVFVCCGGGWNLFKSSNVGLSSTSGEIWISGIHFIDWQLHTWL